MKRRHRNKKRPVRVIRLWAKEDVEKAVPYLRSVVGSLREHWLAVQSLQREAALLGRRPAKTRDQILAETSVQENSARAEQRFEDALSELTKIDVFLLDPVQGLALIPFRKEDELAWFVFDNFDKRGLVGWRLHQDALEECRPLKQLDEPVATDSV